MINSITRLAAKIFLLSTASVAALAEMTIHASAQSSLTGLGDLPDGAVSSSAYDISADGTAVVGQSGSANWWEAFLWTFSGGLIGLGDLPGGLSYSRATAVSTDGTVVVGLSESGLGQEAFRWTQAGGMVGLGDFPGGYFNSVAHGVSADGSVVVGTGTTANGGEAFRWTETDGMIGLGELAGGLTYSLAYGVSADGSVVVGQSSSTNGIEAFRWTEAGGMVGLGDLNGGGFRSRARGANFDGSVIVGQGESINGSEAFRWTEAGGMVGLGDLPGGHFQSEALDVSADGSVVVGYGYSANGQEAIRWMEGSGPGSGMQSVAELLISDGVDIGTWYLAVANGVSDDGKVIVGTGINPSGDQEAWMAVVDVGFVSINNLRTSIGNTGTSVTAANGRSRGAVRRGFTVGRGLAKCPTCQSRGKHWKTPLADDGYEEDSGRTVWALGGGFVQDLASADSDVLAGAIGLSGQLGPDTRTGLGISMSNYTLDVTEAEGGGTDGTSWGVSGFSAFEPDGRSIRLYTSVAVNWVDDEVTRGYFNGITPVESIGEREGHTIGAAISLGWERRFGDNCSLMPFAEYELSQMELDGYTEVGGPFPAVYDAVSETDHIARLGAELRSVPSDTVSYWSRLAWAHQFDDQLPGISGRVPLLGSDFNFSGGTIEQDWAELQFGLNGALGDRARFMATIDISADGENDPTVGGVIGINVKM